AFRFWPGLALARLRVLREREFNHSAPSSSIYARFRRDLLDVDSIGNQFGMHRTISEFDPPRGVDRCQRMLAPVGIVAIGIIFARMGAAALLAGSGGMYRRDRIRHE